MLRYIFASLFFLITLPEAYAGNEKERKPANVRNVELRMTEVAKDGDYEIYPDERFRKVDLNSTLRLDFKTPLKPEDVESSPDWNRLTQILKQLKKNAAVHERLAQRASALMANPQAPFDTAFVAEADAFNRKALALLFELVKPDSVTGDSILSRTGLTELMKRRSGDPYGALSEALNDKRDVLHQNAAQFVTDIERFEVVLRAYMLPEEGGRQALHIPGYDKLPQGDFNQANPLAVLPTPRESKRLMEELKAARTVAASIDEIRENGKAILESVQNVIPELRENVRQLVESLRSDFLGSLPSNWRSLVSEPFVSQVAGVGTQGGISAQLSGSLVAVGRDLIRLHAMTTRLEDFSVQITTLMRPGGVPFSQLQVTADSVKSLTGSMTVVIDGLAKWPVHFKTIEDTAPEVAAAATKASIKKNLDEFKTAVNNTLRDASAALLAGMEHTANAIDFFSRFYRDANGMLELGAQEPPYIPQPLDALQTAELDLRYTGIIEGDKVEVTFDMRPKGGQTAEVMDSNQSVTYEVEATFAGWHRRLDSSVIFSRPFGENGNNSLRPNTSVTLEFHKFTRPNNNWFWNSLDFGFGFHAAFLNHDPNENIEMGAGVNISVLDGLLRAGVGYNISAETDEEYWFFGFGLFSVLNQLKDAGEMVF